MLSSEKHTGSGMTAWPGFGQTAGSVRQWQFPSEWEAGRAGAAVIGAELQGFPSPLAFQTQILFFCSGTSWLDLNGDLATYSACGQWPQLIFHHPEGPWLSRVLT